MTRIAKFLENELDRINNYLSMAEANLTVITELCSNGCNKITPQTDKSDEKVIQYLDDKLSVLEAKITSSKDIINNFKDFYFNLEPAEKVKKGQI